MRTPTHVGLLIYYSYSFYRQVLRGIRAFAEQRPEWLFVPVSVDRRRLRWRGTQNIQGLIAAVNTPVEVTALRRWSKPIVNVGAVIQGLSYPCVRVDNSEVGRLAAEHFLAKGLRHFGFVGHPRSEEHTSELQSH